MVQSILSKVTLLDSFDQVSRFYLAHRCGIPASYNVLTTRVQWLKRPAPDAWLTSFLPSSPSRQSSQTFRSRSRRRLGSAIISPSTTFLPGDLKANAQDSRPPSAALRQRRRRAQQRLVEQGNKSFEVTGFQVRNGKSDSSKG